MPETSKDVRLRLLVDAVNRAGKVLDDTSRDLQEISDKAERLGNATGRAADKGAAALSRFEQAAKKLNTAFKKMETAGERMQTLGTQMGFLGAGMVAAVAAPIKKAADFETAIVDMGKVTDQSFSDIRTAIKSLPPILGDVVELTSGYYQVISAGVTKPKAAIDLLIASSKAAKAAHIDQAGTIKGLTAVMEAYGDKVKGAAEAADLLFAIEAKGKTDVSQLIPVIGNLTSVSAQLGVHQDELGAALARITLLSGSTAEASTQYLRLLIALQKPTKTLTELIKESGYSSAQAMIQQKGLGGTLKELTDRAKAHGYALTKLFETSVGYRGLLAVMTDDYSKYNKVLDEMHGKTGAADQAFEKWRNTTAALWTELKNALTGLFVALGDQNLKSVSDLAKRITEVVASMTKWVEVHPKLAGKIVMLVGILGTLLLALGVVLVPLGIIVKTLGILGPAMVTTAGKATLMGKSFVTLGTSASGAAGKMAFLRTTTVSTMASITALMALFVTALKTWNEALGALEARQEKLRAKRREETWANIETAKVKAFNEATGESAKSLREVNQLQKEKLYYRDLITRQWKQDGSKAERDARIAAEAKTAADKRAAEAAKKRAEAEVGGDGGEGDTEALEKKKQAEAQIILETKRLQIQAMEDEAKRLEAQKDLEIKIFRDSENAKVASKEITQQKIDAIENAYTQRIEAIEERKREEEEKLADQEREKAEQAAQRKIEQQLAFQEETKQMKISMMEDDYARIKAGYDHELELLQQLLEAEEINLAMHDERKAAIDDQYRQRKLALDEAAAEATAAIWDRSANKMQDIFGNLYEISGRKVKAFFYMQRAVAVAQAIMDTLAEVSKVGAQTGIFGIPMKAMVYAQGMARVALIAAQTIRGFAEGGLVKGKEGKDSIIARLTNKEFVMPVEAVQHYGLSVMEAIRRRAIEISSTIPQYAAYTPSRPRYQEGGLVAPAASDMGEDKPTLEATIVNITDPREIEAFLASARGQNALVNAISSQAPRVRRVLR